jgi:8-oxo-dGTP pyrophosphatase MutT (NUDIX family)
VGASSYILALRERIGHDLLLMPSVAVLIRDASDRLLLMKSTDTGDWQTIGGAIDPDETPGAAAHREALEEAGITIRLGRVLGALGGPEYRMEYPNGDQMAYVTIVFDARLDGGTLTPDGEEASDLAWWDPTDLGGCQMHTLTKALLRSVGLMQ